MRVLVTGGTGYIGSAIALDLVAHGHAVDVVARGPALGATTARAIERLAAAGVGIRTADLSRPGDLAANADPTAYDVVVHGVCSFLEPTRSESLTIRAGTELVSFATSVPGGPRIVDLSNCLVLAEAAPGEVPTEEHPTRPTTLHGRNKLRVERMIRDSGLPWVILRIGQVYGGEGSSFDWVVLDGVRTGRLPLPGDGRNRVGLVHVDDVAQATRLVIEQGHRDLVLNVCSADTTVTQAEVFDLVADSFGVPRARRIPIRAGLVAGTATELIADLRGREPAFVPDMIRVLSGNWLLSIDKAQSLLGYHPAYPATLEGISRAYADAFAGRAGLFTPTGRLTEVRGKRSAPATDAATGATSGATSSSIPADTPAATPAATPTAPASTPAAPASAQQSLGGLVRLGARARRRIPTYTDLPLGAAALAQSFVVEDPTMAARAAASGLTSADAVALVGGAPWRGARLSPIDAALLAPAFPSPEQAPIAAALDQAQRAFWSRQRFYLDEMAAPRAGAVPNLFMRDTLGAVEDRAVEHLGALLADGSADPIVWVDYAAGPATVVNGGLTRLAESGADLRRVRVVLVEPAAPFRAYAVRQPALAHLQADDRLVVVEGILEDAQTHADVEAALGQWGARPALVTQSFGASYIADHLRPAMWRALLDGIRPDGLALVVATTTAYNPSRMILDRLSDERRRRLGGLAATGEGVGLLDTARASAAALQSWVTAFVRPVPAAASGRTTPALAALIGYGRGVAAHCPIYLSGEGFQAEIESATGRPVRSVTPVLDGQAVLLEI